MINPIPILVSILSMHHYKMCSSWAVSVSDRTLFKLKEEKKWGKKIKCNRDTGRKRLREGRNHSKSGGKKRKKRCFEIFKSGYFFLSSNFMSRREKIIPVVTAVVR